MYERFREILVRNDEVLELIADIEDRLAGRAAFSLELVEQRVRKAAMAVFVMVKNVNLLGAGRHSGLYDALRTIDRALTAILLEEHEVGGPLVVPLTSLRAGDAPLAGNKMANLGEVAAACGFRVPAGFAITTAATARFLTEGRLWERCERLEGVLELAGPAAAMELQGFLVGESRPVAAAGGFCGHFDSIRDRWCPAGETLADIAA